MNTQNAHSRQRRVATPATDIYETDEAVVLLADLPGVAENGLSITLEKNVLTLEGKQDAAPHAGYELAYGEYEPTDFRRIFTVSNDVDREKIEASLSDGVLKLVLPKSEPVKPRKIAVKVG